MMFTGTGGQQTHGDGYITVVGEVIASTVVSPTPWITVVTGSKGLVVSTTCPSPVCRRWPVMTDDDLTFPSTVTLGIGDRRTTRFDMTGYLSTYSDQSVQSVVVTMTNVDTGDAVTLTYDPTVGLTYGRPDHRHRGR